jgi:hypothetical protein
VEGEGGVFGREGFDPCGLLDGVVSTDTLWWLKGVMGKMTGIGVCETQLRGTAIGKRDSTQTRHARCPCQARMAELDGLRLDLPKP